MGWTSFFLNLKEKKILINGTGEVASRRAHKFIKKGAKVILLGKNISKELKNEGVILKSTKNCEEVKKLVDWADIIIIASENSKLNEFISSISGEKLLNRADSPEKGNLIVPTSFYIDDIQISLFTNGKSPLMARELRKKIEYLISEEDLIQIKIQDFARNMLKKKIKTQKERKTHLYHILEDEEIKELIKRRELSLAKEYLIKYINEIKDD